MIPHDASLDGATPPSRAAALGRLNVFLPAAGSDYARTRNHDHGPQRRNNVSMLSPYLRHRLVTEQEVVAAVLARHSLAAAEKFIQEVCWRTYWKGWLQQRPGVWRNYLDELEIDRRRFADADEFAAVLHQARTGTTGIDCFDAWVGELIETGYLHNHARMWFASIWIFTLRLPWTLGADFFMHHLLDGDPASNTLSWRWVAGLHTRGKTYAARADNIATYTGGRFDPAGQLATMAVAVDDFATAPLEKLDPADTLPNAAPLLLLVTEEDLVPESAGLPVGHIAGVVALDPGSGASGFSPGVQDFKAAAVSDGLARASRHFGCRSFGLLSGGRDIGAVAANCKVGHVVTLAAPIGPTADRLATLGVELREQALSIAELRRPWDTLFWPHAKAGFFALKAKIPAVLSALDLVVEPKAATSTTRRNRR